MQARPSKKARTEQELKEASSRALEVCASWVAKTASILTTFKQELEAGAPLRPIELPKLLADTLAVKEYLLSLPPASDALKQFLSSLSNPVSAKAWSRALWFNTEDAKTNKFLADKCMAAPWRYLYMVRSAPRNLLRNALRNRLRNSTARRT